MCPGLTNESSYMDEVNEKTIVAVYAKDLEHALVKKV